MSGSRIQKVVVTGGAGAVGSHLVDRLVAAGVPAITVIDRLDSTYGRAAKERNLEAALRSGRVVLIDADVMDPELDDRLAEGAFDVLVHLAAVNGPSEASADPVAAHRTNVSGTVRVLELARHRRVGHLIVAGRAADADELRTGRATLELTREPVDHWSAMAIAAERFARVHAALHGMRVSLLHLPPVFGTRERPDGAGRTLLGSGRSTGQQEMLAPLHAVADALCGVVLSHGDGCATYVPAWEHAVGVEELLRALPMAGRPAPDGDNAWRSELYALWREITAAGTGAA